MKEKVSIVIPTWNNYEYLLPCLNSILSYTIPSLSHIYVVNNGHANSCDFAKDSKGVTVVETGGENLGWEGGLIKGLEASKGEYVIFMNDDTYIPPTSRDWVQKLLSNFEYDRVGAVGPSSNVVMGHQNIFSPIRAEKLYASYLIGFCLMIKRSVLTEVGGVDDSLPGGDDLDLSIRLKDKDYRLVVDRSVFVYHHGFKTGERIHGTSDKTGGWNSYEFKEKTDFALIRKHGFRKWFETITGQINIKPKDITKDTEGNAIRKFVTSLPQGVVAELGVGGQRTVEMSIGVDMIPKGEIIDTLENTKSIADLVADVQESLPFRDKTVDTIIARHILEHMIDPIKAVALWKSKLKEGGHLIIAVPNEELQKSVIMNIEHKHAFTPESLKNLMESVGLTVVKTIDPDNEVSVIIIAKNV